MVQLFSLCILYKWQACLLMNLLFCFVQANAWKTQLHPSDLMSRIFFLVLQVLNLQILEIEILAKFFDPGLPYKHCIWQHVCPYYYDPAKTSAKTYYMNIHDCTCLVISALPFNFNNSYKTKALL